MSDAEKTNERRHARRHKLLEMRVVRDVVIPLNAYASSGDVSGAYRLAPLKAWLSRFWIRIVLAMLLAVLGIAFSTPNKDGVVDVPVEMILTIFPNLLGFLIGVYALIFTLPSLIEQLGGKKRAASLVNADMAMPLTMMALAIFFGVLSKAIGYPSLLVWICWFFLFYVLFLLFEVIMIIFVSASRVAVINDHK